MVSVIVTVIQCIAMIVLYTAASLAAVFFLMIGIGALMDRTEKRRLIRVNRAEAELDRTQEQLRSTMLQLADALGHEAHEARKALIRESFLASGQVPPRD